MFTKIKTHLIETSDTAAQHVEKHRAKYAAATTATVMLGLHHWLFASELNEFLEEKGLTDEYYNAYRD